MNIDSSKNIQSITFITNDDNIIALINSFSKFTSISINADKKEVILGIKTH
ncbi:MAG: hypothetical protein ACOCRX_10050 [Candidatus Woesearchaeota archaeon]